MHDKLIALAEWLESISNVLYDNSLLSDAEDADAKAAEVRAMATRVEGRVLVKMRACEEPRGLWHLGRYAASLPVIIGRGDTPEEAIAALQAELDREG